MHQYYGGSISFVFFKADIGGGANFNDMLQTVWNHRPESHHNWVEPLQFLQLEQQLTQGS